IAQAGSVGGCSSRSRPLSSYGANTSYDKAIMSSVNFEQSACCLTVSEHGLWGMSLRQWSRRNGIAEVLRPLPVPDFGHILKVFADIVVVAMQFLVEQFDCV